MAMILSQWQIQVLESLLNLYENSKTYRGKNKVTQTFSISPVKIFPDYVSDFADIYLVRDFEQQMKELEQQGFIVIIWKNNVIEKLIANSGRWENIYDLLGKKERRQIEQEQTKVYEKFLSIDKGMDVFCQEQIARLREGKKAKFAPEKAKKILQLWKFLVENREEVLERELSIAVLGDSKLWEKKYRSKLCCLLRKYNDFESVLLGVDDKRETEKIVLGEYHVEANPSFVYIKGDSEIFFSDGQRVKISPDMPIALTENTLKHVCAVKILTEKVMTVENLTSFHRMVQKEYFYLFLSGYHNRMKQKLLCKINDDNPGIQWFHFGDIDPDGYYIIEHLIRGTGISFRPIYMDIACLEKYASYAKPLNENDVRKAKSLLEQGKYQEVMGYMLDKNKKLEQEIVSWMSKGINVKIKTMEVKCF